MRLITRATFMSASFTFLVGGGLGAALADVPAEAVSAAGDPVHNFIPQGPEAGTELFPPNPKPGGCYARVLVPAQYDTETIQMLKNEASERLEIIPATYEWIEEQVMVKPAFQKLALIPAEYEFVSEQVIDRPAHFVWEKGRGLIEKVNFATGEIVCLKEIPATYKTVTKRMLKSQATTRAIEIPAEFETVKKRLMKTPPTTKTIRIPEEKKVQKGLKMVKPTTVQRIPIPEEYQTFTKRIKVSEEQMAWKPVLCETNTTPQIVQQLQHSLKEKGFNPGPIDGEIGKETIKAVVAFQKEQGLPRGGLTVETFQALKVDLPWFSEITAINTGGGLLQ